MANPRITLDELLTRNPISLSIDNLMPQYYIFQPLDGVAIPLETYYRTQVTLTWDKVFGDDLDQLVDIIASTQPTNQRNPVSIDYNDYHLLEGEVVIIDASITPLPATGAQLSQNVTIDVALAASVSITVIAYDFSYYSGI
jgi:hypothetical protein